ncbi:MAG: glycoside hydrolase family 3 C-terminal domain-containing protein [Lachnospiraceae bacterium]
MTLEEKAGLCSGGDFWHTKAVERLGIPDTMVSDGPHGLRKQDLEGDHLGINESIKAVCFPTGCATAASFDRDLIYEIGELLGEECQAENVSVILGPAANIKRSPLCGRNFEYFSEDPFVATEMATYHIKGVQSKNVGTSLKHFIANNQEQRRNTSSSEIDERTLREIYLAAFEGAVKEGKPWTVMCSYNLLNGVQVSENRRVLTELLRDELDFDGYAVSDWGAVRDRVKGLKAGLDLEMPSSNGSNDACIIEAVKSGSLEETVLDTAVERILNIVFRYTENRKPDTKWDKEAHHEFARKAAGECMVLLKNEDVLPLDRKEKVAVIGAFAENPRYQGGGSSHINSTKTESAIDVLSGNPNVAYAKGYDVKADALDKELLEEAVAAARTADKAVIFAGLPDQYESEGYDRTHMRMPDCQNELIVAVAAVQPNTIVVLHNGSPVEMPWADQVQGILEAYLGGQAVGGAVVDVLYGDVNPSGRLAETFPLRMEDNPSYLFYSGESNVVEYREGVFVGYRYYTSKRMPVLFPFGYGLSYTNFSYSNLRVDKTDMTDAEELTVSVDVTNMGSRFGKEVVQLYVGDVKSTVKRPVRELRGFTKLSLAPKETKTATFRLGKRAFAYYNTEISDWYVEDGDFTIEIGKNAASVLCSTTVRVHPVKKMKRVFDNNSTIGDIRADAVTAEIIRPLMERYEQHDLIGSSDNADAANEAISEEMNEAMYRDMPLRQILSFGNGVSSHEEINAVIAKLNE